MTSSPKRPWFRFHLLTAVLMTVAAGGMMWINTSNPTPNYHGWPWIAVDSNHDHLSKWYDDRQTWECCNLIVFPMPLFLDILTAVVIICSLAANIEFLIRRREGRKP